MNIFNINQYLLKKPLVKHLFSGKKSQFIKFLGIFLLFLALTIIYGSHLIKNFRLLGRADWDYYFFHHAASQITISHFKQFPFWNPYYCGGIPDLGHPHARFFSPSLFFTSAFGVIAGLRFEIIFYIFLSMLGMYFLCRHLKIRGIAAVVPSIIFSMSGPFVLHLTSGHLGWTSSAYIPFIFLFYLKGLKKFAYVFGAAFFMSLVHFSGGTYILIFTNLFLTAFSLFKSIQKRTLRPIIVMALIFFVFILFAGPKLFPVLEFIRQNPRTALPGRWVVPLKNLYNVFLDRQQYSNPVVGLAPATGWWEFGSYIGILPAVLFFLSFKLIKERWPLILTAIFFFVIGLGSFSKFSPWVILHKLPVFSNMQLPSRTFIFLVFMASVLSGLYLNSFSVKTTSKKLLNNILLLIIFCTITVDLIKVNSPVFKVSFSPFKMAGDSIFEENTFIQGYFPARYKMHGGDVFMYPQVLKNRGIVNGYEAFPVERNAIPAGAKGYRGEYFLLNHYGEVSQNYWSPNKMTFHYDIKGPNTLVINQNYDKNWKSTSLNPVKSYNGLVSVRLSPSENEITIYYFPLSFVFGVVAWITGILLFLFRDKIFSFEEDIKIQGLHI